MAELDKTISVIESWLKQPVLTPPPINELYDALELLKEQEAKGKWIYGEDETGVDGWHCSECGFFEPLFYEFTNDIDFIRFYSFCPSCGRRMTSYTGKPTQTNA